MPTTVETPLRASPGITVRAPTPPLYAQILTPAALEFIAGLARRFEPRRRELLGNRVEAWEFG